MKVDFSERELWALLCTIDGVYPDERSDEQNAAYGKLERAHKRALAARPSTVERDNDGQKGGGE